MPSASPSPTPTVLICTASQLQAWAGPNGAATALIGSELAFVNVSAQPCALYGYPTVQLLDSAGNQITSSDQPITPNTGDDDINPGLVVLETGQPAYFMVFYPMNADAPPVTCPTSAELQLTPPGLTTALTLTGVGAQIAPYGTSSVPCGLLMVTPVTATKLLPASDGS
ncbi:MAG: DUF4232 domain-containing protein [Candidatus Dormiibacterota bacterium]